MSNNDTRHKAPATPKTEQEVVKVLTKLFNSKAPAEFSTPEDRDPVKRMCWWWAIRCATDADECWSLRDYAHWFLEGTPKITPETIAAEVVCFINAEEQAEDQREVWAEIWDDAVNFDE